MPSKTFDHNDATMISESRTIIGTGSVTGSEFTINGNASESLVRDAGSLWPNPVGLNVVDVRGIFTATLPYTDFIPVNARITKVITRYTASGTANAQIIQTNEAALPAQKYAIAKINTIYSFIPIFNGINIYITNLNQDYQPYSAVYSQSAALDRATPINYTINFATDSTWLAKYPAGYLTRDEFLAHFETVKIDVVSTADCGQQFASGPPYPYCTLDGFASLSGGFFEFEVEWIESYTWRRWHIEHEDEIYESEEESTEGNNILIDMFMTGDSKSVMSISDFSFGYLIVGASYFTVPDTYWIVPTDEEDGRTSPPLLEEPEIITTGDYPGIYTIQGNKINDTLYTNLEFDETTDVKIPLPMFRTGLM